MKKNQKGFGAIEILLILVIVGIIGFAGWFVYNSQKKTNQSLDNANKTLTDINQKKTEQKPTQQKDETTKWVLYENINKQYKLRLADGWQLEDNGETINSVFSDSSIVYKPGIPAKVTKSGPGGKDFNTGLVISYDISGNVYHQGDLTNSFKTNNGDEVKKYYFKQTGEPDPIGLPKDGHEYFYIVSKDKKTVIVHYALAKEDKDEVDTVEKVVKTIAIN